MLTSKQRAGLRAMAARYETIFQVGKGGISDEMCRQIANALEARELIKLCVLNNSEYSAKDAASEIAGKIDADVVGTVGNRFILYKESAEHKKIDLRLLS